MVTNNQDIDTQSRWKSRYYEALGEIEEREKIWRDKERLLHHLISRLTLAADTRHKSLSQNLTELRNAVRDGRDILRLRDLIDQISEQVAQLDDMRSHSSTPSHPTKLLLDILERLQIQDMDGREVRQFRKHVNQLSPEDDAAEIVDEFSSIVNSALEFTQSEIQPPTLRQKLLDRILQRQEQPQSETQSAETDAVEIEKKLNVVTQLPSQKLMAPAVGELLLQLALRLPEAVKCQINYHALKRHSNRARTRKDLIAIIDVIAKQIESAYAQESASLVVIDDESIIAISQAVQLMLQNIHPPVDLYENFHEIEKAFADDDRDIKNLIHYLNSIATIIAEICNRLAYQYEELANFFVHLSMRLDDLDLGLQRTSTLYEESRQDNIHIDKTVHDEIRGIQDSMQSASDLTQLKSAIQSRLDTIDQHLVHFHDAEKGRQDEAQKLIVTLGEKVSELELDSDMLRTRLDETRKQTVQDVLTGIPNRYAYEERLASEVARSKRYGTSLTLVVWDVDGFKDINDSYGHASGDRVLKVIAEMLSNHIRETDFVARYGGEEFVMLMPETNEKTAQPVVDKLREQIAQTPFHFHNERVEVTISAGIAQYQEEELVTSLFERADAALYAAKEAGRNQVMCAGV